MPTVCKYCRGTKTGYRPKPGRRWYHWLMPWKRMTLPCKFCDGDCRELQIAVLVELKRRWESQWQGPGE